MNHPTPEPPLEGAAQLTLHSVYQAHFDFVWRSLRRLGIPEGTAEDVAQDVFLVVQRRLPDFDPSRSIRAWLFGIARRVASDWRRSRTREERRLQLVPTTAAPPSLDEQAAAREAAEMVRQFLGQLDENRRAIFMLSDIEGMTGAEIAEALDMNVNTVYSRLRGCRQKFEKALKRWNRRRA